MIAIENCPTCGSKRIARVKRTINRVYKARRYQVPDLEFWQCPNCGERLFDVQASKRIDAASPAFGRSPRRRRSA